MFLFGAQKTRKHTLETKLLGIHIFFKHTCKFFKIQKVKETNIILATYV